MTTPLDAIRDDLLALEAREAPLVTATFDLSPDAQGRVHADTVLRQALSHEAELDDVKRAHDLRSLGHDEEAIAAAIDEAVADGAQGLLYAGAAADGIQHTLTTPLPFRNVVRIAERPYIVEVERYRYLYGSPLVLVRVHHDHVDIHRTVLGRTAEAEELDTPRQSVSRAGGRSNREAGVSGGQGGMAGGHSKNKVEESVEAHRESFARDAAERLAEIVEAGDLLVVAGSSEPRSGLIAELRDDLRERAVEENAMPGDLSARDLADYAGQLAAARRFADADGLATDLVAGASPERTATGMASVTRALTEGRVEVLVLHDDIAGHFGTAEDTRHHDGRWPGATVDAVVRDALGTSARVEFSRHEPLLTQSEGLAAHLRW